MYNTKAFLEGLIVNEVLTKTASFEKLAAPPVIYPYIVPQALRAANDLWERWRASQKPSVPPATGREGNSQQPDLGVRPKPSIKIKIRNNGDRGAKHLSEEEIIEEMKRWLDERVSKK
jgi:hypothetical protein